MAAEVTEIAEDFARELAAIQRLVASVEGGDVGTVDTTLRLAAVNASILLIAALFEQFVRELVEEACNSILSSSAEFAEVPPEISKAAWERSLSLLRGLGYGTQMFNRNSAITSIEILSRFCMNEEIITEAASLLEYNMNNMKASEINTIFRRIGIRDFCYLAGRNNTMVNFFGAATADISHGRFLGEIDEFYETRNAVAHFIGSTRGAGPIQVSRYIEFFDCVARVFATELNLRYPSITGFERESDG